VETDWHLPDSRHGSDETLPLKCPEFTPTTCSSWPLSM